MVVLCAVLKSLEYDDIQAETKRTGSVEVEMRNGEVSVKLGWRGGRDGLQ